MSGVATNRSSHGHRLRERRFGVVKALIGSVARTVSRRSQRPVLLVPGDE